MWNGNKCSPSLLLWNGCCSFRGLLGVIPDFKITSWAMIDVLLLTLTSLSQLSVPLMSHLLDLPSLCHPYSVLPHISVFVYHLSCPCLLFLHFKFRHLHLFACFSLCKFSAGKLVFQSDRMWYGIEIHFHVSTSLHPAPVSLNQERNNHLMTSI